MNTLPPEIFKAYDVRGIVGRTLTPHIVEAIGQAIGSEARARRCNTVAIGRDGRLSGPELAAALARGLQKSGVDVIDVGQVATPMLYFAAYHLETHSGVSLTGSHNPPDYNGLKMMVGGETLWGDGIQALRRRIERGDLAQGSGSYREQSIRDAYLERITADVKLERPLSVVVDCGNGVAGGTAPCILNAANEVAVASFLDGRLPFLGIAEVVERTLNAIEAPVARDLEELTAVDEEARRIASAHTRELVH